MAYNPAEGNNPYTEEQLEAEHRIEVRKGGPRGRYGKTDEEIASLKAEFCKLLEKGCTVTRALEVINGDPAFFGAATTRLGRKTVYMWRIYDEEFREAWDEAYSAGTDRYEQRLADFAMEEDPKQISKILSYRNPRRYSVSRQEISGPDGGPMKVDGIELIAAVASDTDENVDD